MCLFAFSERSKKQTKKKPPNNSPYFRCKIPGKYFPTNTLSSLLLGKISLKSPPKTFSNEKEHKQLLDSNPMVQGFPAKYL